MEAFLNVKYFSKVFKFIVSSNFNVRITIKAMKLFYFTTGVVYCSLNSTMQEQWFSNLGGHQNPLEGLLNSPLAPSQSVSWRVWGGALEAAFRASPQRVRPPLVPLHTCRATA